MYSNPEIKVKIKKLLFNLNALVRIILVPYKDLKSTCTDLCIYGLLQKKEDLDRRAICCKNDPLRIPCKIPSTSGFQK